MAAGQKKKKKPVANPARGFATTSIASKVKHDVVENDTSTPTSDTGTPIEPRDVVDSPLQPSGEKLSEKPRELHELTPEQLEAQLETSDLQRIVEQYAAKTRKESSRQVTKLQTEKRLLRGQSEFLSLRDWLPEELLLHAFDLLLSEEETGRVDTGSNPLIPNEELLAKVWQLDLCLLALGFSSSTSRDAIHFTLSHPPFKDPAPQVWGLAHALDWISVHSGSDELHDYDYEAPRALVFQEAEDQPISPTTEATNLENTVGSNTERTDRMVDVDDSAEVSDIESDIEPDEMITLYLKTKARLFEMGSGNEELSSPGKKSASRPKKVPLQNSPAMSAGQRKLQQRLQKIQSDILFDQREAEHQWSMQKIELLRIQAERQKLRLSETSKATKQDPNGKLVDVKHGGNDVNDEAERLGRELLAEPDDSDGADLLGGMFDALPGVRESNGPKSLDDATSATVTVRDFGKSSGLNPKRVFEEACKARDPSCKIKFTLISPTTYSSRHSLTVQWSAKQEVPEPIAEDILVCKCRSGGCLIEMKAIAAPDITQSESYIATAALFMIFSDSPKEAKAHLKLPPSFRDVWHEFAKQKQELSDATDRNAVKSLRELMEEVCKPVIESDEIVFNPATRRQNGAASGTSTPSSRTESARIPEHTSSEALKDMWARRTATTSYQHMLQVRMALPMFKFRDEALDVIQRHQVTILCGETGCGKSTQLPAFILEHDLSQGKHCKIYCTEPRRISAISLAQRVGEEMGDRKGDVGTSRSLVGYSIRLESQTVASTRLVYATVGIVLRMLENSDGLKDITHLILDEVHERSIDTDFLLIILRSIMLKRPDLKVVLMSATVDAQRFSSYFDGAPIVSVPGRTFPVQAKYLEDAIELTGHTNEDATNPTEDADDEVERNDTATNGAAAQDLSAYSKRTRATLGSYDEYRIDYSLIVKVLEKVAYSPEYSQYSKAVLIFLPGISEIRQLNDMLVGHPSFSRGWRVHALHSTFSSEDQQAAFEIPPADIRKIVLATNIAETGITIPDVTCVIDTGKHKEMRFDERRQMSRLIQSFIARANAKQRRGRAGRVQKGLCFHLFTKHRHDNLMVDQQTPEMLRLSLQDLVMRVKICKLGDIEHTLGQALDPPSSRNIRRAIDALIEVDALTTSEDLTPLGQQLAKLPLDAQLGKLILYGSVYHCLDFALTVAATLSSKSPFLSPMHAKKQADSVRLGFKRGDSDLLTVYNAYSAWRKICNTSGVSEQHFCNKNFLSTQNLANIEDLKGQLLMALVDAGFVTLGPDERSALSKMRYNQRRRQFIALPEITCRANENDEIANSVVAWSFYPKILNRDGKGWRNIANNQSLGLHPTSVNKHNPRPDMKNLSFYSIMQTSSRFTNAQETSPVSDFALVLLAGDAVFHMYAGVIVIDGNRLKYKVRDWKSMIVLKTLRNRLKECQARLLRNPGRELGSKQKRWMDLLNDIFARKMPS